MGRSGKKACCECGKDVSHQYRIKDAAGRYTCDRCFAKLAARKASAKPPVPTITRIPREKPIAKASGSSTRQRTAAEPANDVSPDTKQQYVQACQSMAEIVAASDAMLALWSELEDTTDDSGIDRSSEAQDRHTDLLAAARKWLEKERQRLGIDESTADILENGENPFDVTSTKSFLR